MDKETSVKHQNYLMVTITLLLTGMMIALNQFKIPMIMTDIADQFDMSMTQSSWLMAIFTFMGIFLALPGGGLASKFGAKNMVFIAAVFVAIGCLVGAFSQNGSMLIFSRALEGVGFIFVAVCGPMAVSQLVEPKHAGSAIGIWAVWVCLGQVISFALTPILYGSIGLRGTWILYGVLTLIFGLVVLIFIKDQKVAAENITATHPKVNIGQALANKNLWFLCLSFGVFNIIFMSILNYGPTYLAEFGISTATTSFAFSIPMFIALISSPVFGKLMDVFNTRKKLYLIALLSMGPCAAMIFTSTGGLMYAGLVLMGVIGLGVPATGLASVGEVTPRLEHMGLSMGLIMTLQNTGQFLGSLLVPYFLIMTGNNWTTVGLILLPIGLVGVGLAALSKFK